MKRLEYTRQSRKTHLQSKAAADVVMLLAQITFEKRAQIGDAIFQHRHPLDPHAGGAAASQPVGGPGRCAGASGGAAQDLFQWLR